MNRKIIVDARTEFGRDEFNTHMRVGLEILADEANQLSLQEGRGCADGKLTDRDR